MATRQSPVIDDSSAGNGTKPRLSKLPGLVVVLALLVLGFVISPDYGVSWDESSQRGIGGTNLRYIRSGQESVMDNFADKDYGPAFEIPLSLIEEASDRKEFGEIIWLRHVATYLFFLAGVWCGYLLSLRIYRRQWIALLGIAMLVMQPRIFAHAFFNSKDIPFLSAMLIALSAVHAAFHFRRGYWFALAGVACGYAAAIRNMGLLLPMLAALAYIAGMILPGTDTKARKKAVAHLLLLLTACAGMLYLCWPLLWHNPVGGLVSSFRNLSRFIRWDGSVLFNGAFVKGTELPWYYAGEWFCISTPPVWLLLGFAGLVLGALRFARQPTLLWRNANANTMVLAICAASFVIPLVAVIVLRSVLYDDWRHLYFVYPFFVMLALYAASRVVRIHSRGAMAVQAGCLVQMAFTGVSMVIMHPFQQVYFNLFVPDSKEYRRRHFDYDYWGASTKQGLDWILAHDGRDIMVVLNDSSPLINNINALPPESRRRIAATKSPVAGAYLLTNYRYHPDDYPYPLLWSVRVSGSTVIAVYRIGSTNP